MYNNKFFIGLGATVPSTRVIKPPGGDCSDLFGLKTRQRNQIKGLKGTSSVIDYLLRQQSEDSQLKKFAPRNAALSLLTRTDVPRIKPSSTLTSQTSSDHLNFLNSTTESVAGMSAHKNNVSKELTHLDIDSVRDGIVDLNIADNIVPSNVSIQENVKTSPPKSELSCLENKSYENTKLPKASDLTPNNSVSTKASIPTNNRYARKKALNESVLSINKDLEKKFIHNPITGVLTEVKSWRKSNPVISGKSSMQGIKSKACMSEMSASSKATLADPMKDTITRRNPITGEGISLDLHLPGISRSRIRVIQPPGGTSSGIY